ncbi:MAG: hypothetical protein A3C07_05210 [Candidatus Sungbacteria bacterium RIFCSPHIGHO2_02_FULL_47_11]|uniref:Uncharacterized protein n=1 Tax=Candidatus Sungbacteria bacterium RIFCSPHIGHO2_02_FULL_47_11 TaxID=1802270 RepID=A0A1G2KNN6_9BACT|nr:MAG: hypothetical protein A3C07_05210 [Candidatus Sungbacteria bacterium RIFCSPHIGHO2_02_FULL_47_11]
MRKYYRVFIAGFSAISFENTSRSVQRGTRYESGEVFSPSARTKQTSPSNVFKRNSRKSSPL